MPVIKVLRESLAAAQVTGVMGIVNGTTNYILSAHGADRRRVRRQRSRRRRSSATPRPTRPRTSAARTRPPRWRSSRRSPSTAASTCTTCRTRASKASPTPTSRTRRDLGLVPKLLGVAKLIEGRVNVRVYPGFIPAGHPLAARIGGLQRGLPRKRLFDEIMLFGPGAGGTPTASAVIGDIISIVNTAPGRLPPATAPATTQLGFFPSDEVDPRSTCASRSRTSRVCWRRSPASSATRRVASQSMHPERRGRRRASSCWCCTRSRKRRSLRRSRACGRCPSCTATQRDQARGLPMDVDVGAGGAGGAAPAGGAAASSTTTARTCRSPTRRRSSRWARATRRSCRAEPRRGARRRALPQARGHESDRLVQGPRA